MNIVLISTYELGRQPFGLASPAAWLREMGARVRCLDLSREALCEDAVRAADLIAFYVPMHTATRLAVAVLPVVRELNARGHICFYGLYAPVNEEYLRRLGVGTILGGEFEEGLAALAARLQGLKPKERGAEMSELKLRPPKETKFSGRGEDERGEPSSAAMTAQAEPVVSLARLKFLVPDRSGFVPLSKYARLVMPDGAARTVGYTEASRGCKHLCRHCPIVPVYQGAFRIVERDVVLEDIRRQVAAGAEHISFGDPDFFNGVGHALPLVEALHREFPGLSYDVIIKVEHLLKHRDCLARLRETGCLFITSAVESVDDAVVERLDKHHTRADFLSAVSILREIGLTVQPTFVPFTPWTTIGGFCELLDLLREQELVENVAPIQLAIRLLIPAGSRLLELADIRGLVGAFDEAGLVYPWRHSDARVDRLCGELQGIVHAGEKMKLPRAQIFERIEEAAYATAGLGDVGRGARRALPVLAARAAIPYLNEPWYC
ncbi:MAG: CUAEP/CCAEP-tail radical SAM protein [Candidatus Acidiferrales bacterium]